MFRFTIRDVLWLTVVVGLSVGWWTAERLRGPENARLREEVAILLENDKPSAGVMSNADYVKLATRRAEKLNAAYKQEIQQLEKSLGQAEEYIQSLRDQLKAAGKATE